MLTWNEKRETQVNKVKKNIFEIFDSNQISNIFYFIIVIIGKLFNEEISI